MKRARWGLLAALLATVTAVSALATDAGARSSGPQASTATIKVGIVYSRSGAFTAYGARVPLGPASGD